MLTNLPTNLIIQIFSHFSGKDISRFKQLSKFYKELIGNYQHRISRPVIDFSIHGDIYGPTVYVEIKHIYNKWKYTSQLPPALVHLSKWEKVRKILSLKMFRNRLKRIPEESRKEKETVPYNDFFSTYRNDKSTEHNLLPLFEFVLEKADIDSWACDEKHFNLLLTEALNKTSGRVLHVYPGTTRIDCNLLKAVGSKKFADKAFPTMQIGFSNYSRNRESQQFWSKAGIINEIALSYGHALLNFEDMDYGILKIAEMWSENGCPNINFQLQKVNKPWFFADWDVSSYRQLGNFICPY